MAARTRHGVLTMGILSIVVGLTGTSCSDDPVQTSSVTDALPGATGAARGDLAAATRAFAAFNAALDAYASGARSVDDFRPFVSPEYFDVLVAEETGRDNSTRTIGSSSFKDSKLVSARDWGGHGDVALVVCRDITRTSIVDSDGNPSSALPLRTRIPLIIYFVFESPDSSKLLVQKVDQWNEDGYCV